MGSRLKQYNLVASQGADTCRLKPSGPRSNDNNFGPARCRRERVGSPMTFPIARGVYAAALRTVGHCELTPVAGNACAAAILLAFEGIPHELGSAMSARAAPTMSQTPDSIAASPSATEVRRPKTLSTGIRPAAPRTAAT